MTTLAFHSPPRVVAGVRRVSPTAIHVVAPVLAGAAIYLLFHAPTLLAFGRVDAVAGRDPLLGH